MKNINRSILLESEDPIEALAMAIVYSGVIEKDVKFFVPTGPGPCFGILALKQIPLTGI